MFGLYVVKLLSILFLVVYFVYTFLWHADSHNLLLYGAYISWV